MILNNNKREKKINISILFYFLFLNVVKTKWNKYIQKKNQSEIYIKGLCRICLFYTIYIMYKKKYIYIRIASRIDIYNNIFNIKEAVKYIYTCLAFIPWLYMYIYTFFFRNLHSYTTHSKYTTFGLSSL